ncbi:MAG: hypothetical protein EBW95_04175 [Burkholderiaceae bacterium]|jgi:hypothetical protein|nr:hypothetical protein [Burkholderiaceae bacterium]NCX66706.1 hypothetical protein [Burkholderiaceae bacterium]
MLDRIFPASDHFTIKEIDHVNRCVIVEDKELGLEIKLAWGAKELKSAAIVDQYEIRFVFTDGSDRIVKILS